MLLDKMGPFTSFVMVTILCVHLMNGLAIADDHNVDENDSHPYVFEERLKAKGNRRYLTLLPLIIGAHALHRRARVAGKAWHGGEGANTGVGDGFQSSGNIAGAGGAAGAGGEGGGGKGVAGGGSGGGGAGGGVGGGGGMATGGGFHFGFRGGIRAGFGENRVGSGRINVGGGAGGHLEGVGSAATSTSGSLNRAKGNDGKASDSSKSEAKDGFEGKIRPNVGVGGGFQSSGNIVGVGGGRGGGGGGGMAAEGKVGG
ncbi:glycine-rich protein 23-like [Gossypium hirsutum]|uniref:Glycine-rich protein 23-like n=1 Tax=Gossypium hirsutum TaxID=3635 RepID=A0ABM2ZN09_GOSHI|nr:glycine-rich protein 23-like [Gossypium hirsutum]